HGLAGLGWFVLEVVDQVLTITSVWTGSTYLDDLTHHFKDMATISFTSFPDYFTLPVICYFGPIMVSLGFLCSLRQTLGRCRIRTVQILRVVAYTSTPFSIFGAALLLALTTSEVFIHDRISLMAEIILGICYLGSLPFCLAIYLSAGLKCYLQLPRAWFVGIIIAFVGYLFSPTIFAFVHAFIMNY
ncbi:MAG: hypothetical protein JSV03_05670, partial [Planctomycetota bacterium]